MNFGMFKQSGMRFMKEVKKLLQNKLEELKRQEATLRNERAKYQDRAQASSEHLASVVKQVEQFQEGP